MKLNRRKQIEKYIVENESASLDTLCELFNVSKNTIRRDIAELEDNGIIKKVYGGIILNHKKEPLVPFEKREIKNQTQKHVIAKLASELVDNGDIIFIDSGTTTMHMIPFLADKTNVTVITNNLNAMQKAVPYPNLNVISPGGTLFRKTYSLIGLEAVSLLKKYNISKCFMATTGVSIDKGVTNSSSFEFEIKKTVINIANKRIILADNSKLDVASLMTYMPLKDVDVFISNCLPNKNYLDFFKDNNIELITPY